MTLEDLQPDATVRGILPDALVTVVSAAAEVRRSGQDTKWRELANLLGEIFTDFNGASINLPFADLLARAEEPA